MWSVRSNDAVPKGCKTMKNDFLSGQNEEPRKERLQRRNQMNQDNKEIEWKTEQKGDEQCARKIQRAKTQKERKGQKN
jgi:hypothetical protein